MLQEQDLEIPYNVVPDAERGVLFPTSQSWLPKVPSDQYASSCDPCILHQEHEKLGCSLNSNMRCKLESLFLRGCV